MSGTQDLEIGGADPILPPWINISTAHAESNLTIGMVSGHNTVSSASCNA